MGTSPPGALSYCLSQAQRISRVWGSGLLKSWPVVSQQKCQYRSKPLIPQQQPLQLLVRRACSCRHAVLDSFTNAGKLTSVKRRSSVWIWISGYLRVQIPLQHLADRRPILQSKGDSMLAPKPLRVLFNTSIPDNLPFRAQGITLKEAVHCNSGRPSLPTPLGKSGLTWRQGHRFQTELPRDPSSPHMGACRLFSSRVVSGFSGSYPLLVIVPLRGCLGLRTSTVLWSEHHMQVPHWTWEQFEQVVLMTKIPPHRWQWTAQPDMVATR